jgi:hypothetical protein
MAGISGTRATNSRPAEAEKWPCQNRRYGRRSPQVNIVFSAGADDRKPSSPFRASHGRRSSFAAGRHPVRLGPITNWTANERFLALPASRTTYIVSLQRTARREAGITGLSRDNRVRRKRGNDKMSETLLFSALTTRGVENRLMDAEPKRGFGSQRSTRQNGLDDIRKAV